MKNLSIALDKLTNSFGIFSAWLVVPLIIVACYEVAARYIFGSPTSWAFELGYMITGSNFLLGIAFALKEKSHIRIEALYQFFPEWAKELVNILTYILIIIPICGWLSYSLYLFFVEAYLSQETTGVSVWDPVIWPFRLVFVVSFGLICLQGISELIKSVDSLRGESRF